MSFYWIYDIPQKALGLLMVTAFITFSVVGQRLTRRWVRRLMGEPPGHNDIVSYYLSAFGVFYGITLGLISVGAWQNFADVDSSVSAEASSLAALYRDVSSFPEPVRGELRGLLRNYTRFIIDEAWAEQRHGVVPAGGVAHITRLQERLATFEPRTTGQQNLHAEALRQFNHLIELGQKRLQSVESGLPIMLWRVVVLCAALNIALTWLLVPTKPLVHDVLTGSLGALLGLLIFMMAVMDNPFRGQFSVGSDAYEQVFTEIMK
jgi:hypothetical protein